jgi:hypothetical protein
MVGRPRLQMSSRSSSSLYLSLGASEAAASRARDEAMVTGHQHSLALRCLSPRSCFEIRCGRGRSWHVRGMMPML